MKKSIKSDCCVIIDLKRKGDGSGSGYNCKVVKDGKEIYSVTPPGNSPESCLKTLMDIWE